MTRARGAVQAMATEYGVSWHKAWRWMNREAGLCVNGCGPSERYRCEKCTTQHVGAQFQARRRAGKEQRRQT